MNIENKNNREQQMTFLDLALEWLINKSYQIKQSTINKYQSIIDKYIAIYFSDIQLSTVNTVVIEKIMRHIYEENNEKLSFSSFKGIFYVVKAVINYGIHSDYIPQIYITFSISNNKEIEEVQVLNEEQERELVKYLMKNISNPNHLGIFLSLCSGMRLGEVCSLKIKDIDFEQKLICVNKTVQRLKDSDSGETYLSITTPKSKRSKRTIPITNFLLKILKNCEIDNYSREDYLIGRKEIPYEPRTLQYAFKRVMEKCGYDGFHFHCLRHTFATKCVHSGFEIKTLSEILGHSSVAFTMNRYVHSDIDEKRKQMNKLEANWNKLME